MSSQAKSEIRLDADKVSHISVEDHYCYIYYSDGAGPQKVEVGLALQRVLEQAPKSFLRIHRSHAVNPNHLARIERRGRTYQVTLRNGVELPVSRHRLDVVLQECAPTFGP